MQTVLLRALLWVVPSLSGTLASAIVSAIVQLGHAEVKIMTPVVKAYIARADLMPEFTEGIEKFVWVFKSIVKEFPEANRKAIGTLINVLVQAMKG
jgi:hypothetical protein